MDEKVIESELQRLFSIIERYEENVDILESKLENLIKIANFKELEILGYEIYKAYEKRIPWYKLSVFDDDAVKKAHAIIELEYNSIKLSVGYNMSSNSVSFSVNGSPVRFFKLGESKTTGDPGRQLQAAKAKFVTLMRRLLKVR